MKKIHSLSIVFITALASCSGPQTQNRAQNGEAWLRDFAKEQFEEDAKHLVSYDLESANEDSTQLVFIVQKFYKGERTEMPPFTVFLNKDGEVNDDLTRDNL